MQRAIRRDVAPTASGRSWKGKTCHTMLTDLTFNLMAIKLMAVKLGGREGDEGGMHDIRDKDARHSGQLLFFREKCCIFALSFKDRLN